MSEDKTTVAFMERVTSEPVSTSNFPTHLSVLLKVRAVLRNQGISAKELASILACDPVVSAHVIRAANTAVSGNQQPIRSIHKAVLRLGVTSTRRVALAVTMGQLSKTEATLKYSSIARTIWLNSLYCSAAAMVLAEHHGLDEQELALYGLMLNLGAFYLLYRAASDTTIDLSASIIKEKILQHYAAYTKKVIEFFGFSKDIRSYFNFHIAETDGDDKYVSAIRNALRMAQYFSRGRFTLFGEQQDVEPTDPMHHLCMAIEIQYAQMKNVFC